MFACCRKLGINYSYERAIAAVERILNHFLDMICIRRFSYESNVLS